MMKVNNKIYDEFHKNDDKKAKELTEYFLQRIGTKIKKEEEFEEVKEMLYRICMLWECYGFSQREILTSNKK